MAKLMDDIVLDASAGVHRPRNLDWKRAAALLYGDWGTSKAYVIGLAFVAAGFSSLPIILAVCALTGLVGINYIVICRHFPDGGGVYSAARDQGRLLAVVGALLLVADLTVTAALSGWSALSYITSGAEHITWIGFLRDHIALTTISVLLLMGLVNYFGPKHSGSFAVALALPTAFVVVVLIAMSAPHLTTHFLEPRHQSLGTVWVQFVGVILALSGAESIANLTGVMKLDPGSTMEHPSVARESVKAITPVAIEVVLGTALLGWAMLSLPSVLGRTLHLTDRGEIAAVLGQRSEDMLRFIGEQFATATFSPAVGQVFGWIVGIVFCLLLLSAANTAIVAMIGLLYMMSRDGEMPRQFKRLNRLWRSEVAAVHRYQHARGSAAFCSKLHCAGWSLCHWRSRCDHGQRRFVRIQSHQGFHLVRSHPLCHHFCNSWFRRADAGPHETRRASIRAGSFDRRTGVTRLHTEASRPHHAHGHAGSCQDGHARPRDEYAAAFGGRSKNHGGSARDHSGAQLRDGRSAITQGHSLCALCQGGGRLLHRSRHIAWSRQMAG